MVQLKLLQLTWIILGVFYQSVYLFRHLFPRFTILFFWFLRFCSMEKKVYAWKLSLEILIEFVIFYIYFLFEMFVLSEICADDFTNFWSTFFYSFEYKTTPMKLIDPAPFLSLSLWATSPLSLAWDYVERKQIWFY